MLVSATVIWHFSNSKLLPLRPSVSQVLCLRDRGLTSNGRLSGR